ncbi:hypothetical protein [Pseudovibrio brasiliensis]|uniref:Uncharacterized protein n=1 Tax=Pseudovibrio brasiliensis TaxID=1898042 RepID=A0ABX8AVS9_9HYPH|nr:hypothetical protein [Pseudovibrio brasiliensis]QUS59167.1 hypothetical protein KGB56_26615 [Pseudovibrio brasiliensis]
MTYRLPSFNERVDYAHQALLRGEDSRKFDNCFEMWDGAFVVAALMRRSLSDPELRQAIKKDLSSVGLAQWQQTTASLAHIPTHKLSDKAAAHRRQVEKRPYGFQQPSLF